MSNALSPAIFIDRDGTIMQDCVYCSDPKKVRIFPGVPDCGRLFGLHADHAHVLVELLGHYAAAGGATAAADGCDDNVDIR